MDVKPVSQEKTESERGLLSQCGKPILSVTLRPAYDQVCDSRLLTRAAVLTELLWLVHTGSHRRASEQSPSTHGSLGSLGHRMLGSF